MFRLYDQTRRRICVAAFFMLCVVPTAGVAVWCVVASLPGRRQAEAQRLGQLLGLDVSLDGFRSSRPGVVVYEGLRLSDPETGQAALRCGALEAEWTRLVDPQGQGRPAVVLTASTMEIEAAGADRLWQLLQRVLQSQNGRPEVEVRLTAAEMTVRGLETSQPLVHLEAGIGILPGGIQAQAAFRLPGAEQSEPVRVRIVRNRQIAPPANGFELDTGGNAVSCQMLWPSVAELKPLGHASRFAGYAWARETPAGWEGEMSGRWLGVDLGSLVSDHFPHKLTGLASVSIQRARFRRGRLEEAAGEFSAGPGTIGRTLVEAAAASGRLARAPAETPATELLRYDQLAMDFAIDARGITLRGRCGNVEPCTLLAAGRRRLLGEPAAQPLSIAAVIQALAPAGEIQVPASRQADWLARHLPLPEAAGPQ